MEKGFSLGKQNSLQPTNNQLEIDFAREDKIKAALKFAGLGISLLDEVYEQNNQFYVKGMTLPSYRYYLDRLYNTKNPIDRPNS